MLYKDVELKKEKVRHFLNKNPQATYKEIKSKIKIKIEKVYSDGMHGAFKDAGITPPRSFERKTKEEKKRIIIDYIKKHPKANGHLIRKETKINFLSIFNNTKEAFEMAGVPYPREAELITPQEKIERILQIVRNNPKITITELRSKTKTNLYNFFNDFKEIYQRAGVKAISGNSKRTSIKKKEIIEFIKNNPLATQREINNACKTHVQELFNKGIFKAYRMAGVKFPYERLKLHGTTIKSIKERAKSFEDNIALKLSGYGKVNRLVKTKRGIADIILERKNKKVIVEVKDYQSKDISISQIKQLNRYLEDCNCNTGILICPKKPKKDIFLIGKNKLVILEEAELNKIPGLIDGAVS